MCISDRKKEETTHIVETSFSCQGIQLIKVGMARKFHNKCRNRNGKKIS